MVYITTTPIPSCFLTSLFEFFYHSINRYVICLLYSQDAFLRLGFLMATFIAQEGSGFQYLFCAVFDYLCGRQPTIDSNAVPDYQVRTLIDKVIFFCL